MGLGLASCAGTGTVEEASPAEPAPLQIEVEPVTRNADWEPIIQDFDGVEMALVPAGCFMMGSSEEELDYAYELCETYHVDCDTWFEDETPQHEVCFEEPFWIDVYEVTNEQYGSSGRWSGSDLPREFVTWLEAVDHCASRGARLPTEAEWEYAARGPDGLVFPWGNAFDGARLNYCDTNCTAEFADTSVDDGYPNTAPVGSYPDGISWVGAYDLSGNVSEWVADWYGTYPSGAQVNPSGLDSGDYRVVRGAAEIHTASLQRAAIRGLGEVDHHESSIGFRCALSYQP
jgi:formylglycine-generating enzyme required for sulfatase activity